MHRVPLVRTSFALSYSGKSFSIYLIRFIRFIPCVCEKRRDLHVLLWGLECV
jgi:hypothetical protein